MQVLALFSNPNLGSRVVEILEGHGAEVSLHMGIDRLMSPRQFDEVHGMVVEDDDRYLETWLPFLSAKLSPSAPILVYGHGSSDAITKALCAGAHDYASASEGSMAIWSRLSARFELIRRKQSLQRLQVGEYVLDKKCQQLSLGSTIETLTARETSMLAMLAANPAGVTTLESLSLIICRRSADLSHRSIEQHVYRLRKKIDELHHNAKRDAGLRVNAVYGVGYKLDVS